MFKKIKQTLFISLIALTLILLFCSCNNSPTEKVNIETALSVDSSFSGSRTVVCRFPKSIIALGSQKEKNLDKVIQKYCPDSMDYTKNIADEQVVYCFRLKFTSSVDYTEKVSQIIGLQATVSFSNPNTVLTKGWKIEENFQSSQLINWIYSGAKTEDFSDINFELEETSTTAAVGDDAKTSSSPIISVNNLNGYPIQKISIETVNKKNSVYDRTVVFTVSQTTFDELGDNLTNYFKNITDSAASSTEWLLENNAYLYTVKFTDVSLKELEGYTNNLLSSVYSDAEYEDKTKGSTPLAEQNRFRETLDFSNYVGNNNSNVPVEYTYSVKGSAELGECMLYENGEWAPAPDLLDTNRYGSIAAIKSSSSLLCLEISDGRQYPASAIDFTVVPLDNDSISKTITFRYEMSAEGEESAEYTKSYFQNINIGAVTSVNNGQHICSITFSGNESELNSIIPTVLGTGNLISYSQHNQPMTLRTVKQFSDHINLSEILVGKNSDTPVNYYIIAQNGDIVKSLSSKSSDTENMSSLEKNTDGAVTIKMAGAENDVNFDVSVADVPSIVMCCIISFILIAVSVAAIIYFKSKKDYISLPQGEEQNSLPNKNELAKNERKENK